MNLYTISSLIAFVLLAMGLSAFFLGFVNYFNNQTSLTGKHMFHVFLCVFFWNFGYAWMGLCFRDDFAYIPRAIALLAVNFYMVNILLYVRSVTDYPKKRLNIFLIFFLIAAMVSWSQIIQKTAVTFVMTKWGYWYKSSMSWARLLQFASVIAALVQYYVILNYGKKHTNIERDLYVLKQFGLFGPILFTGYLFDTLIPTIFHSAAVPGSCISAFFSALVLFRISSSNSLFGLTKEKLSEYVFRDVDVPVVVTNHRGEIVLFNDYTVEYLNCNSDDLLGKDIHSFLESEDEDVITIHDFSNNETMKCKIEKTDVNDKFEDLLYSIYFVTDVTKEQENLRLIEESRIVAENANRAKSDFLANMSHEIRTPINAILGMDEMILREGKEAEILDYATNIKQAGNMLLALINDILDFAKIESGKMEIVPVNYEISSLINDLYVMSYDRAIKKGLKFIIQIDEDIPSKVLGDDVRLRQIITNLLTNAIKYTNEGEVVFSIKKLKVENNNVYLRISVKDSGIGIREEDKERLFDAFQRLDLNINRSVEGTGLGLSITINLLRLMKTELNIESVYGEGSEFYFDITQMIIDDKPIGNLYHVLANNISKKEVYRESFKAPDAKVLIVDDNVLNLKVASNLLKKTEVQVTTVTSGFACLNLLQEQAFDIILMDHMMPEMDGIETVRRIRELEDNPSKNVPIIALTANAVSGAEEMFLENGFDDFLSKPVKGKKLEDTLLKHIPEKYIIIEENVTSEENVTFEEPAITEKEHEFKYINRQVGLSYCMDDENLYREVLELFINDIKLDSLNIQYYAEDYENYKLNVHALKTTSRNIGAVLFSDYVEEIETAIINQDYEFLEKNHDNFIANYRNLIEEVKSCITV